MTGLLVTGTDTGVGKTHVACALARALVAEGLTVGVMKPAETGDGDDAERLVAAAGCRAPMDDVRPYRFALPAAPSIAAAKEGGEVELPVLTAAYGRLADAHDVVLVEGAGGLLVPLRRGFSYADLAAALGLPLLIVARTAVGTINHTALTERVAFAHGARVLGVALCAADGAPTEADRENLAMLREMVRSPVLATFPHGGDPEPADLRRLVEAARTASA